MKPVKDIFKYYNADSSSAFMDFVTDDALEVYQEKAFIAKKGLREMLRNHPTWNEYEQSVTLESSVTRTANKTEVFGLLKKLLQITDVYPLNYIYSWFMNDEITEELKEQIGEFMHDGRKKTRVLKDYINSLGRWDKSNAELMTTYAKLADAITTRERSVKLILSIHPGYFLTMSNPAYSRRGQMLVSCHSIDRNDYEYTAGCTGYGTDEVTMIAFTVDSDTFENRACRKTSRQLFMYKPNSGILLQSRMYNSMGGIEGTDENTKLYRQLVQDCIALCEDKANLWNTVPYPDNKYGVYFRVHHLFGGYPDWDYSEFCPKLSVRNDFDKQNRTYVVGNSATCLHCGTPISEYQFCYDCIEEFENSEEDM